MIELLMIAVAVLLLIVIKNIMILRITTDKNNYKNVLYDIGIFMCVIVIWNIASYYDIYIIVVFLSILMFMDIMQDLCKILNIGFKIKK